MQNNRQSRPQKTTPNFLHQFGFVGRAVVITSTKGRPLQPMAKGVNHSVHWAVYKVGVNQPHGEIWVENELVKIIKVFPQEVRPIWEASVGKDGRRPPVGWQEAVDAAISMAMCSGINCKGHWPPEKPVVPREKQQKEVKPPARPVKPLPTKPTEVKEKLKPKVRPKPKTKEVLTKSPEKQEKAKAVEVFAAKKPTASATATRKAIAKKPTQKPTISATPKKRGRPPKK